MVLDSDWANKDGWMETSYSISLCPRDLITKSWRQRSRIATRKQYSLESVTELLQCQWSRLHVRRQTNIPTRRAGHGEATWTVGGSPGACDQKTIRPTLIVTDDYDCRPTAGRTSMPGMVVPSSVDIWTRAKIGLVCTRFGCQQEATEGCHAKSA